MASEKHILIVDDEEDIIQLILHKMLSTSRYPFQPLVATDGYEALDFLKTKNIAVLILDIFMRHLDGMDVCRRMKADKKLKGIPIIISSGFLNPDNLAELQKLGIRYFLQKPYPMDDLFQILDQLVKEQENLAT